MALIISADEIKKTLPGYDPEHSEDFHKPSAQLADKQYAQALRERREKSVILMSGGAASGKSEYVSVYLRRGNAIVLDGTLPTFEGAKIKIKAALKAGKTVAIHAVLPEDFLVAFVVFLNRERKFGDEHFYRTHSNARKTLRRVAQEFPQADVRVIISKCIELREGGSMKFREAQFDNRDGLIAFLSRGQYNEDEIRNIIFDHDV